MKNRNVEIDAYVRTNVRINVTYSVNGFVIQVLLFPNGKLVHRKESVAVAANHHLLIHANELSTLGLPMYHVLPNHIDVKHPIWVLFAMLSSGWATTTGRSQWEISLKRLSQGHSDALQRKSRQRESNWSPKRFHH